MFGFASRISSICARAVFSCVSARLARIRAPVHPDCLLGGRVVDALLAPPERPPPPDSRPTTPPHPTSDPAPLHRRSISFPALASPRHAQRSLIDIGSTQSGISLGGVPASHPVGLFWFLDAHVMD
ncbi:hypothetical protein AOLI_G00272770 [Acnodon oligacanthus]